MAENQTPAPEAAEARADAAVSGSAVSGDAAVLADAVPLNMAEAPPGVRPCTIAAALEMIGEKWSLLALRELGYGVNRFTRIAAFTGAPRDILADRLRKLE